MTSPRLVTYSIRGSTHYGAIVDGGVADLSARFGKDYPTLREVIAAGALLKLADDAERRSPDHALDAISFQPPIPAPEKIICIGVNYPDRNAEYKDGSDAPKFPSMFMRTPRSFVGHNNPLIRPRASGTGSRSSFRYSASAPTEGWKNPVENTPKISAPRARKRVSPVA